MRLIKGINKNYAFLKKVFTILNTGVIIFVLAKMA